MMIPLKIAFLWHQHQPYYKFNNEFILPWVRMHGVKDYFDLPEILHEFPEIKQTFNFAPSLNKQINEYIAGAISDKIQTLTKIPANNLTDENKLEILELFFKCQKENLIDSRPRYKELYDKSRDKNYAMKNFSEQDWRDLQVWYNLTWIGFYSSKPNHIKRLFKKKMNYTEYEKHILLDYHIDILKKIVPQMQNLANLGQVDISVSPMYHPILPLIINSESAKESMPDATMPAPLFKWKDDAYQQISKGINYFENIFGNTPKGMWPSEGSVSDETLEIIAKSDIKWVATDEDVLYKSKKVNYLEKYFPFQYNNNDVKLTVFFRDHILSDKIGFEYSKWNPWDAANDFIHNLNNIRNDIIKNYGESALDKAVVSVILDGENCWEFYKDNGIPFLRELYKGITNNKLLKTILFSEALDEEYNTLNHIHAGSWINADFNIWIGDSEDIKAWELLGKTRAFLEDNKNKLETDELDNALEHIYAAEGSDWFWWYGPEHHTDDKDSFDAIFRWHLSRVYEIIGETVPDEINIPISDSMSSHHLEKPGGLINPDITGNPESIGWEKAGVYKPVSENAAMHQIKNDLNKVLYGTNNKEIFFRMLFNKELSPDDKISINTFGNFSLNITMQNNKLCLTNSNYQISSLKYAFGNCIDISVEIDDFVVRNDKKSEIDLHIKTLIDGKETQYPTETPLHLEF